MEPGQHGGVVACVLSALLIPAALLMALTTPPAGQAAGKTTVTFYGVVHDTTSQAPVAGAKVIINHASTLTNATGHYTLTLSSSGTSFHITASAAGYLPVSISLVTSAPPRGLVRFDLTGRFGLKPLGSLTAVIGGVVQDAMTGHPVFHAAVTAPGKQVATDLAGHYLLTTHAAPSLELNATALGYQWGPPFVLFPPDRGLIHGRLTVNFSGSWGLLSVLDSRSGATLSRMTQLLPATIHAVPVAGAAHQPISSIAVTYPNGDAALLPFTQQSSHFSSTLTLDHGRGIYQLEINAQSGFALFNLPLYAGIPYTDPPLSPTYPPNKAAAAATQLVEQLRTLINNRRAIYHRPPLRSLAQLDGAALAHSKDVVAHAYYATHPHIGSDGSTPAKRVTAAGVRFSYVTEDVALSPSIQGALQEWLVSPSHRAALLSTRVTAAGIGIVRQGNGNLLVTVDLIHAVGTPHV